MPLSSRAEVRAERRMQQDLQRSMKLKANRSPTAVEILIIRHGETQWNAEHRLQGQLDPPLNQVGILQAEALATHLKEDSSKIDSIYSSDLQRAAFTAHIIAARCKASEDLEMKVILDRKFRERSLGCLEGLTPEEAMKTQPHAWSCLRSTDWDTKLPEGESGSEVQQRASAGLDAIAREHPGQKVVVVTHGGTLQAIYREACGHDYRGRFKNCAINTLWIDQSTAKRRWTIGVWGDTFHLAAIGSQQDAFGGGLAG